MFHVFMEYIIDLRKGSKMDNGYIENGFIVDVSNTSKTSEIIYELSRILDLPDAQSKKVCLKLGSVDLTSAELTSIKALVESMNSEIEFISTSSTETIKSAEDLNIKVSFLENKVPTPEFNNNQTKVNNELEKALDKIFGDDTTEIKTFAQGKDIKKLKEELTSQNILTEGPATENIEKIVNIKPEAITPENQMETINKSSIDNAEETQDSSENIENELENFNNQLENANKIEGLDLEDVDFNLDNIRKSLRETEKLPTLYIQRTLRSGQSITSDGNIVIIGDANPGSEIIAKGDITVWGILGGIAHAGSAGNQYARIRALKMNAIQLRIADVFARRPDNINIPYIQKTDTFVPEEACIRKKQIIIHKIHEA